MSASWKKDIGERIEYGIEKFMKGASSLPISFCFAAHTYDAMQDSDALRGKYRRSPVVGVATALGTVPVHNVGTAWRPIKPGPVLPDNCIYVIGKSGGFGGIVDMGYRIQDITIHANPKYAFEYMQREQILNSTFGDMVRSGVISIAEARRELGMKGPLDFDEEEDRVLELPKKLSSLFEDRKLQAPWNF